MADAKALAEQLTDEQLELRVAAAEELAQMGESAQAAAVALVRATGDRESVSQWAIAALEELGAPVPDALQELAALVGDEHELISYWAVTLLGRLGAAAASGEEALVTALASSQHMSVRQRAAWALEKLGTLSPATIETLRSVGREPDARLARLARQALNSCGLDA